MNNRVVIEDGSGSSSSRSDTEHELASHDDDDLPPLVPIGGESAPPSAEALAEGIDGLLERWRPQLAALLQSGLAANMVQEIDEAGLREQFMADGMDVATVTQTLMEIVRRNPTGPIATSVLALFSSAQQEGADGGEAHTIEQMMDHALHQVESSGSDSNAADEHSTTSSDETAHRSDRPQLPPISSYHATTLPTPSSDNNTSHATSDELPTSVEIVLPHSYVQALLQNAASASSSLSTEPLPPQVVHHPSVQDALRRYWELLHGNGAFAYDTEACTHGLQGEDGSAQVTYDDPFDVPLGVCPSCEEVVLVPRTTNPHAVRTLRNPQSLRQDGRFVELFELHAEHLRVAEGMTQLLEQQRDIRLRLFEWQQTYSAEPIDYAAQNNCMYRELQRSVSQTLNALEAARAITMSNMRKHRRDFVNRVYRTYPHSKTEFIQSMRYEIEQAHPNPLYIPGVADVPRCTACDKVADVRLHHQTKRSSQQTPVRACQCRQFVMCLECLLEWYWNSSEQLTKSFAACPTCQAEMRLGDIVRVHYGAAAADTAPTSTVADMLDP